MEKVVTGAKSASVNGAPGSDPVEKVSHSKNNNKPAMEEEEMKDNAVDVAPVEAVKKMTRLKNNNNCAVEEQNKAKKVGPSNSNNKCAVEEEDKDSSVNVAAVGTPTKKVYKVVDPADNRTMVIASEVEHEEEKSDDDGPQEQCPSVAVVRDGGKVLVPFSSLKSAEEEATDINESAVATHLCSKAKKPKSHKRLKVENSLL